MTAHTRPRVGIDPPPLPGAWVKDAACSDMDPDIFFPERGAAVHPDALDICAVCEVRSECLAYALEWGIADGIWGGYGPRARKALRHKAKLDAAAGR